jgi:hypothetical protein
MGASESYSTASVSSAAGLLSVGCRVVLFSLFFFNAAAAAAGFSLRVAGLAFEVKAIVVVGASSCFVVVCVVCVFSIFSTKSDKCTVFAFRKKCARICLQNVLVFCCPEARQGALYAVSQGLNFFLGLRPKKAHRLRKRRKNAEDGATAPKTAQRLRGRRRTAVVWLRAEPVYNVLFRGVVFYIMLYNIFYNDFISFSGSRRGCRRAGIPSLSLSLLPQNLLNLKLLLLLLLLLPHLTHSQYMSIMSMMSLSLHTHTHSHMLHLSLA